MLDHSPTSIYLILVFEGQREYGIVGGTLDLRPEADFVTWARNQGNDNQETCEEILK